MRCMSINHERIIHNCLIQLVGQLSREAQVERLYNVFCTAFGEYFLSAHTTILSSARKQHTPSKTNLFYFQYFKHTLTLR